VPAEQANDRVVKYAVDDVGGGLMSERHADRERDNHARGEQPSGLAPSLPRPQEGPPSALSLNRFHPFRAVRANATILPGLYPYQGAPSAISVPRRRV
jgi:hypothetical protein